MCRPPRDPAHDEGDVVHVRVVLAAALEGRMSLAAGHHGCATPRNCRTALPHLQRRPAPHYRCQYLPHSASRYSLICPRQTVLVINLVLNKLYHSDIRHLYRHGHLCCKHVTVPMAIRAVTSLDSCVVLRLLRVDASVRLVASTMTSHYK